MKNIFRNWCLLLMLTSTIPLFGQNYSDSLSAELLSLYQSADLPGFAVAIVDSEGLRYQQGFGLADRNSQKPYTSKTIQHIGSVSKTVVGLALVKAIETGALSAGYAH